MQQSFVATAPPTPTGMGGDNDFTFQSPGISPALWGQPNGYNPALRDFDRAVFRNDITTLALYGLLIGDLVG